MESKYRPDFVKEQKYFVNLLSKIHNTRTNNDLLKPT